MSWFPELLKTGELLANVPHPGRPGNDHGESIMSDPQHA
jgi:hypothetical protein